MNASLAAPIVVLALTLYLVYTQPLISVPFTGRKLRPDYGLAPFPGIILLLLFGEAGVDTIWRGVAGSTSLRPFSILVLILSLAYISASLDSTGFFNYLAMRVVNRAQGRGHRLFVYLFLLPGLLTLVVSNDVVTLTMTHIIFYTALNGKMDPLPFLVAGFFAVNVFGAGFYIGNPTNIVAAEACGLSVAQYAKWMFIPTIAAGFTSLQFCTSSSRIAYR